MNTAKVDDNIKYSWKISFYREGEENPFLETVPKETEYGYFILTSYPKKEVTGYEEEGDTFSFHD